MKAVELHEVAYGVVQITMQDKENKNTFSTALIKGLIDAYEEVKVNKKWKVVVFTGYDNYFASGGTQQALLDIFEGKTSFTDINLYSLAMDCEVPVISAMQGHGVGGGFVMGMYGDIIIFSRESVYAANFMRYGFTPGMGATYILPKKLGMGLSHEMMFSANNYRGAELGKRGLPYEVLPRKDVLSRAHELAASLSEKPRTSLVALKRHLVQSMRDELPDTINKELKLHDLTFHQAEVKDRINDLFGR